MKIIDFDLVEYNIDYWFCDQTLLRDVLIKKDNKVFEYFGKKILDIVTIKQIIFYLINETRKTHYDDIDFNSINSKYNEKQFEDLKNKILSKEYISNIVDKLNLCEYQEKELNVEEKVKLFYSLLGAIQIDQEDFFDRVSDVVTNLIDFKELIKKYK